MLTAKDSTNLTDDLTVEELAVLQGVKPIASLEELKADFWPEDESVDEFIQTIRQWREEDSALEERENPLGYGS